MCGSDCTCPIECSTPVAIFEQIAILKNKQYEKSDNSKYFVLLYRPSGSTCESDEIMPSVLNLVECDNDSLIDLGIDESLKTKLLNNNEDYICVILKPVLAEMTRLTNESAVVSVKLYAYIKGGSSVLPSYI